MMATELELLMGAYDWQEAMNYAKFRFDQIDRVVFAQEGEADEHDWHLIVELHGGGFGVLSAGCDYTGWDCQAGGESGIYETEELAWERLKGMCSEELKCRPAPASREG